jgi:hypothetical protein
MKSKKKSVVKTRLAKKSAPKIVNREQEVDVPIPELIDDPDVVIVTEEELRLDREKKERETEALKAEAARVKKLGLVEYQVKGTNLSLLGMPDPFKAPPTMAQRVAMANRLIAVAPSLPKYLGRHVNAELPGKSVKGIIDHATEFGSNKNSFVPPEAQEKMEKVFKGALKTIAKHDPESASAAFLSGKKMKKKKPEPGPAKPKAQVTVKNKNKAKSMQPVKVPPGGFNKTNKPGTSGELIRSRIVEHKLTDEQIATETRKLFEGRNTQVSDVRWNRGQMRKYGVDAPDPVGDEPQKGRGRSNS